MAKTFRTYAVSGLAAIAAICFAWAGYQSLRDGAAKSLSDVSFYGSMNTRWEGRSVVDATTETRRQFPAVVAGPEVAAEGGQPHTVRLVFRAEADYRVRLRLIQATATMFTHRGSTCPSTTPNRCRSTSKRARDATP
jgi:hypothetical protein